MNNCCNGNKDRVLLKHVERTLVMVSVREGFPENSCVRSKWNLARQRKGRGHVKTYPIQYMNCKQ